MIRWVKAMMALGLAVALPVPLAAQDHGPSQSARQVASLTLPELRSFLESAEYRVLATVEETRTLRVQGGEDPAFFVKLEQCDRGPDNRCTAIMMLRPDTELSGLSDAILLDANRGFSGIKVVTLGPEKTIVYRRYLRLGGGVSPAYLQRQLVTFELQYKHVAQHLRERVAGN